MTNKFEESELKPHISILPEVNSGVLEDLRDESSHPVREHWEHLANEQPVLLRHLLVKANSHYTETLSPQDAFWAGALLTHESLHEQSVRDRATVIEEYFDSSTEIETKKQYKTRRFRALRIGAILLLHTKRHKTETEIDELY